MTDQGPRGLIVESKELLDAYHVTGKDFPVPDSAKGVDSGPQGLVAQSAKQKDASLNMSGGKSMRGPVTWGDEGRAFSTSTNGGESNSKATSEQPTYVSGVSCVDGQSVPDIKKQRI